MTNEENELLLKVLCTMLSYGVKIKYHYKRENNVIDEVRELCFSDVETLKYNNEYTQDDWCEISWKPYLRPMSSMTFEEFQGLRSICPHATFNQTNNPEWIVGINGSDYGRISRVDEISRFMDWLNTHHFDYRGLIEKGLALEAPEGMYKI